MFGAVGTEEGDLFLYSPRISMLGWTRLPAEFNTITRLYMDQATGLRIKTVLQAQLGLGIQLKIWITKDGMVTRDGATWILAFTISSG